MTEKNLTPIGILQKAVKRCEDGEITGAVTFVVTKSGRIELEWSGMLSGDLAIAGLMFNKQVEKMVAP